MMVYSMQFYYVINMLSKIHLYQILNKIWNNSNSVTQKLMSCWKAQTLWFKLYTSTLKLYYRRQPIGQLIVLLIHHLLKSRFVTAFSCCMKSVGNGRHFLKPINFVMTVENRDRQKWVPQKIEIEVDYRIWNWVQLTRHILFHHSKEIPNRWKENILSLKVCQHNGNW